MTGKSLGKGSRHEGLAIGQAEEIKKEDIVCLWHRSFMAANSLQTLHFTTMRGFHSTAFKPKLQIILPCFLL